MSRNAEMEERAAKLAQRKPAEPPKRTATPRTSPVRLTTDVAPQTHRALARIAADLAERTGQARVNYTDILRALIAELEVDEDLQAAVAERLSSSSGDQ